MAADIQVLRPGDPGAAQPYTICIIANPALEAPWRSKQYVVDPVMANSTAFTGTVHYILDALFGTLPGQIEPALGDPAIAPHVRVVSIFDSGQPVTDANALVGQDPVSTIAVPRRQQCAAFALRHVAMVDVVFAVTASPSHQRASAFFTSDDDTRAGQTFQFDGRQLHHRYYPAVPGTVALPVTASSLTALHEFQHAASSYTNGSVTDLYVDNGPALRRLPPPVLINAKAGRPIPGHFAAYGGLAYHSDAVRDHISYPASWTSYHCELHDPTRPAVMDDYWQTTAPLACLNDRITRAFLRDRILAKVRRPAFAGPLVASGGGTP